MTGSLSTTDRLSTGQATLAVSRIDPQATGAGPRQDIGRPVAIVVADAHDLGEVAAADPPVGRVLECCWSVATVEDQRVVAGPKRDDVRVGVAVERAGSRRALHAQPPGGDGLVRLEPESARHGEEPQLASRSAGCLL